MKTIKDYSLYLVTGEEYSKGRSTLRVAEEAISGGIDMLELREKGKPAEELRKLASRLSAVCRQNNVIFIVNDDPFLAKELDADGVHLGQEDIKKYTLKGARDIVGSGRIIGVSTHSRKEFDEANESDFDYIAFGPIFSTATKNYAIGTEEIGKITEEAKKPVIFIGGINHSNIDIPLKKGARNIAVIRAITEAEDIREVTRGLKSKLQEYSKEGVTHG
jgi:thiamine-phosphate pyrophosphorylase